MSDPQSAGAGDAKDNALAKTAGFVVFSGIAMSILKALTPLPKNTTEPQPLAESTQQINIPPKEPLLKVTKSDFFHKPVFILCAHFGFMIFFFF